jgi:ABC-type nickel/cobalt efflux system permease component RcnA
VSLVLLALAALVLGAAHALQPGHGKALVAATVVADGGDRLRGGLLAGVTTLTHTGSVFLVGALLWATGTVEFRAIDAALARTAGFVIAGVGAWRLGRHLARLPEHEDGAPEERAGRRSVIGLGVAGGLVPCWDAVGLVVLAAAVGRLGLGLALVVAFSAGMGVVLLAVGWVASKARRSLGADGLGSAWARRLGLTSGVVLVTVGGYLLWR